MTSTESSTGSALKSWLKEHGGQFHTHTHFMEAPSGMCVIASEDLPKDTTIVSCPFGLAITQEAAQKALESILDIQELVVASIWSDRQWISTYICLHWILEKETERLPSEFIHSYYLKTLPSPEKLRTPLHFTPSELELFKGTNLYGATIDREREWRVEWSQCRSFISNANGDWGNAFTWDDYLTAATYLSSRAFPSSLLSPTPSLQSSSSTGPILLPGIDSLNHARAQPVSWVITYPDSKSHSQEPSVSLVLHTHARIGQELLNNYGPKPNSEFILGYGFSLANNPDDTIVLKIGGITGKHWEIGRDGRGAEPLWNEIVHSVLENNETNPTYEDQLDASEVLMDMVQALLNRLPITGDGDEALIRPEIASMFHDYVQGQRDILNSLLQLARAKEQLALELARAEGIEIVMEDDH